MPPLLKAISSQNECSSTIGLALISIHLACLCVELAGAAAGRVGAKEAVVSACMCVRTCMCMDSTRDIVSQMERRGKSQ